jgi:hypothetical protein
MAYLTNGADLLKAFYRAVGTKGSDRALTEQGEKQDDVAYLALNHGCQAAQRFVLSCGGADWWEKRSSAITWLGTEASDGGRYAELPDDFLRFAGGRDECPLLSANNERWAAREITVDEKDWTGDYYYLRTSRLWITRNATPPSPVYLEYIYEHPEIKAGVTLDFPELARPLIVAYAAQHAVAEGWYAGGAEKEARLYRNVETQEREARKVSRRSRQPRRIKPPRTVGTRHWA